MILTAMAIATLPESIKRHRALASSICLRPLAGDHRHELARNRRGFAVAININTGNAKLDLLCPAWKTWGSAKTVKPGTRIVHIRANTFIPFADSEELVPNSGLPASALIEVGNDHRLADPESLFVEP